MISIGDNLENVTPPPLHNLRYESVSGIELDNVHVVVKNVGNDAMFYLTVLQPCPVYTVINAVFVHLTIDDRGENTSQ